MEPRYGLLKLGMRQQWFFWDCPRTLPGISPQPSDQDYIGAISWKIPSPLEHDRTNWSFRLHCVCGADNMPSLMSLFIYCCTASSSTMVNCPCRGLHCRCPANTFLCVGHAIIVLLLSQPVHWLVIILDKGFPFPSFGWYCAQFCYSLMVTSMWVAEVSNVYMWV